MRSLPRSRVGTTAASTGMPSFQRPSFQSSAASVRRKQLANRLKRDGAVRLFITGGSIRKKKKKKAIESRKSPVTTRGVTRMWLRLVRVRLSDYLFVEKGSVLRVWSHSLMYNVSQNPILERWQICHRAASPSQLPPPASSVGSGSVDT